MTNTGDSLYAYDSVDATATPAFPLNLQSAVIQQLKTNTTVFAANGFQNIAGAAGLSAFRDAQSVSLSLPAAYVVPRPGDGDDNIASVGYRQLYTETFGVVVVLDNSLDTRGQSAIVPLNTIKWQLRNALGNWIIDPTRCPRGAIIKKEYELFDCDRAYCWWIFEFDFPYWISDEDVYQVTGADFQITANVQVNANSNTFIINPLNP